MIYLDINYLDYQKYLFSIFNQLSLFHYLPDGGKNLPFSINFKIQNNIIYLSSKNSQEIKIKTPCRAHELIEQLEKISKTFYFEILDIYYYPLDQKLLRFKKSLKLTLIHNLILKSILLNREGIEKILLYKIIWPNDKDYQVNKLDTHITNLKNIIQNTLDKKINFVSNNGFLKFNI